MIIARRIGLLAAAIALLAGTSARAEVYHHYFGNTHSHTGFSDGKETPADHFRLAKASGYDFYAVTDHALKKYKGYTSENYEITRRAADEATDGTFVGIAGFEFSENDSPEGRGHLNALNTTTTLDATGPSVDVPTFYDWLIDQPTTAAASFNHPGKDTYANYGYLTPARRDGVTMYEMINGRLHYEGFLAALNKGWRVAPIAALDNHNLWKVTNHFHRTGVLAPSLTRDNIMQAMRARRVYATWDRNLRLTFRANGEIMGSVLRDPHDLTITVRANDPDVKDAGDRITRIEIVGVNGKVLRSKDFSAHTVSWNLSLKEMGGYCFVQVYCADKTDGPTAYSAPVWMEFSQ